MSRKESRFQKSRTDIESLEATLNALKNTNIPNVLRRDLVEQREPYPLLENEFPPPYYKKSIATYHHLNRVMRTLQLDLVKRNVPQIYQTWMPLQTDPDYISAWLSLGNSEEHSKPYGFVLARTESDSITINRQIPTDKEQREETFRQFGLIVTNPNSSEFLIQQFIHGIKYLDKLNQNN